MKSNINNEDTGMGLDGSLNWLYVIANIICTFLIVSFFLNKLLDRDKPLTRYRQLQQYIQPSSENVQNLREMANLFGLEGEIDRLLRKIKKESGEQGVTNGHINKMTLGLFISHSTEDALKNLNNVEYRTYKMTLKEEREYHRLAVKYLRLDRVGNKGQGKMWTVCDEYRNRAFKEIKTLEATLSPEEVEEIKALEYNS